MVNYVENGQDMNWPESALVHPARASNMVNGGDPVVIGDLVGMATTTATNSTDLIAIRHVGVGNFPVVAKVGATNTAVTPGSKIYIDGATAVLSLDTSKVFFGWAIQAINGGVTANIDVLMKHGAAK